MLVRGRGCQARQRVELANRRLKALRRAGLPRPLAVQQALRSGASELAVFSGLSAGPSRWLASGGTSGAGLAR
eukprot:10049860-Alexandrium_andersonii.AAC.1